MLRAATVAAAAASVLLATPADAAIYTKNSPVLQVDAKNYDRLIAQSNHTSVCVEPPLNASHKRLTRCFRF